ncbi:PREDICTED: uncharacterized protein LOC104818668 [Tarenaya hassleriana]|uniref:uncharacterized protein LOC104818668 n=1 Tax=Tarenaya hassleriana TaxID=28532 RepID=UPI00053C96F1|nr:PREDICTED: uncharacterized protein LOC104818668 [Tarenaya hassleriana]XP_010546657.1 PREDICTED: uncharacterized protein LOC104818668 [Tarenaya hassleriana]
MECNKEEAMRAKELAEEKMRAGDFIGAQKFVKKAQQLFPNLENLTHLVTICDVHCSAQNKISGLDNWYGILQLKHFVDVATIKKQYRKLALLLHPDKNKFSGAEAAFKLVGEANRVLADQTKRSQYDIKYRIFSEVSALKSGNKQPNTNSAKQFAPANVAANSVGNQIPMNLAFWTCCEHCGYRYKYLREYVDNVMHCSSCQRSYVAVETGPYGVSPRSAPSQVSAQSEVPSQGPRNMPLHNNSAEPTGVQPGNAPTKMDTNEMKKEKLNENDGGDHKTDTEVRKPEAEKVEKLNENSRVDQKTDTEIRKPVIEKDSADTDAKVSKAADNKGGTMSCAEVPKANAVKGQSKLKESVGSAVKPKPDLTNPNGNEASKGKSKERNRRNVAEKSSESFEIDGCDNIRSENAVNGKNKKSSQRKKRKVSYAEDGKDDDDDSVSPPTKSSKLLRQIKSDTGKKEAASADGLSGGATSDGSPAIAETRKEKAEKKAGSVFEDISSTKDKRSESCESNGKGAFPSSKVDEIDKVSEASKENPKSEEYPDPEFSNFDEQKGEFAVNQLWALYDPRDGMPRFYAQISEVSTSPLKLQMAWLEPLPVKRNSKNEIDIPIACGVFKSGEMEETGDLLMFSHQMHCNRQGSRSFIYPKKGETWALFRDWDISWITDPDKHKQPYKYDFVEVLTDYKEKADAKGVCGIGVYYLEKMEGFVSLFVRATQGKVLACNFLPSEMHRFSHKVPSFRMTGTEGEGVPADSFELDPIALPKDIFQLDPREINAEMDGQNLDGKAGANCPTAPEIEASPESVCSPMKRQKIERDDASVAEVSNRISNDRDKIPTNVSSPAEIEGLFNSGHDSSSSCQVDEMNTIKKSGKSDRTVDGSRQQSTHVLSEKNNLTNSNQQKAVKKTAKDGGLSAQSDRVGLSGGKMNTQEKAEKDLMTDSLRIRRSPRTINKRTDGSLQANPRKHESNDKPFSWSEEYVSPTKSKRSNSGCRKGQENAFNFKEERSEDKFQVDQIWALCSADKGMPTVYGLIRKIETVPIFRLFITSLEPYQQPKNLTRPVCCGLFKKKTGKPKAFPSSSFSHQVSAKRTGRTSFEVYPRKGEIWAMYKNNDSASCTDTSEYDIVEVLEDNGQIIKAMLLTRNRSRTRYIAQRNQGTKTVVMDIPKGDVARFSHQIPAFRHHTRRDQLGCELWELDPAAIPGLTIVID